MWDEKAFSKVERKAKNGEKKFLSCSWNKKFWVVYFCLKPEKFAFRIATAGMNVGKKASWWWEKKRSTEGNAWAQNSYH